ncbi:hypothetical protein KIPB_003077, partial [Kipferlia bialata]
GMVTKNVLKTVKSLPLKAMCSMLKDTQYE